MFFIAYAFKGQVKIVSHSSCRTSAMLKYFVPLDWTCDCNNGWFSPTWCTNCADMAYINVNFKEVVTRKWLLWTEGQAFHPHWEDKISMTKFIMYKGLTAKLLWSILINRWIFCANRSTVKPVLSGNSKIDRKKVLIANGSLMKVKSIEFCNTFDLH